MQLFMCRRLSYLEYIRAEIHIVNSKVFSYDPIEMELLFELTARKGNIIPRLNQLSTTA
jgi:hypothetical protein